MCILWAVVSIMSVTGYRSLATRNCIFKKLPWTGFFHGFCISSIPSMHYGFHSPLTHTCFRHLPPPPIASEKRGVHAWPVFSTPGISPIRQRIWTRRVSRRRSIYGGKWWNDSQGCRGGWSIRWIVLEPFLKCYAVMYSCYDVQRNAVESTRISFFSVLLCVREGGGRGVEIPFFPNDLVWSRSAYSLFYLRPTVSGSMPHKYIYRFVYETHWESGRLEPGGCTWCPVLRPLAATIGVFYMRGFKRR